MVRVGRLFMCDDSTRCVGCGNYVGNDVLIFLFFFM